MDRLLAVLVLSFCMVAGQKEEDPATNLVTPSEFNNESYFQMFYANQQNFDYIFEPEQYNAPKNLKACQVQDDCPLHERCHKWVCKDPCDDCGPNSQCKAINHEAVCTCLPGFKGDAKAGCSAAGNDCDDIECTSHDNCHANLACISNKCRDPCDGLCKENSRCKVVNHVPACACEEGFGGNPFFQCTKGGVSGLKKQIGGGGKEKPKKDECIPDWPQTKKDDKNKTFIVVKKKLDWIGSYLFCMSKGWQLAKVDGDEDFAKLKEVLKKAAALEQYWIGARGRNRDPWIWFPDETVVQNFTKWYPGKPNIVGGFESCLELVPLSGDFVLNDICCGVDLFFVCETYEEVKVIQL